MICLNRNALSLLDSKSNVCGEQSFAKCASDLGIVVQERTLRFASDKNENASVEINLEQTVCRNGEALNQDHLGCANHK